MGHGLNSARRRRAAVRGVLTAVSGVLSAILAGHHNHLYFRDCLTASQRDGRTVDLVAHTFERTYRRALTTGVITSIREANGHPFARCVVLINNVSDRIVFVPLRSGSLSKVASSASARMPR
jgi:hypothetical protein